MPFDTCLAARLSPSTRALRARLRIAALLGALVTAACNPQPKNAPASQAPATTPPATPSGLPTLHIVQKGSGNQPVRIVQSAGNRKLYELTAASSVSRSAQAMAQASFQQPTVVFYDKSGTTLKAQAPTATLDQRTRQVRMSGGVHATTSSGLTLVCDRLIYDRASGMIHGEGNVRMTGMQGGSRTVLTGNVFDSDVTLTQMRMR